MAVNNQIYDDLGHGWWDADGDGNLVSLRYLSNPLKQRYIESIVAKRGRTPAREKLLDVGCGGGYLSEALAAIGFRVTGVDPSPTSLRAARNHARENGLTIDYCEGCGEALPFVTNAFDLVCCCDVLEHVPDYTLVVREIARVLKPGGIFFYDTINRTLVSRLIMITVMQDWERTAFLNPDIHDWQMFIKPRELLNVLGAQGLVNQEIRGLAPGKNFIAHYRNLRKRAKGEMSWPELGRRLKLAINDNRSCTYIGYAIKSGPE